VVRKERPAGEGRLLQLIYHVYVAASAIARFLPERFVYGAARIIGGVAAKRSGKRNQVATNLARITGEAADSKRVQGLVVDAYRSYARYWLETFRLVREDRDFFLERFRCDTAHRLDEVAARGKGVIIVVGHLGNWDAAGAWVGARGGRLVTVAEVLKPRRMFDFFVEHRAKLGMTIFAAESGVTKKLVEEVEAGSVVAILGDRDLKGTGPKVSFFGETATFPAGPASIALDTGVPILVAGVFGTVSADGKRGWDAIISDPIELPEERTNGSVAELTQRVATELERFVAMRPEEWHVFQPFWSEDRRAR
jgi:KDO2-lipid IV(A) lauroyltransferase